MKQQKRKENGLLPVHHPPINFKADSKGHRIRNYVKHFFALSLRARSKKDKMGCTSVDAERMK
jgi:hypothetical protein